jgi:hypothetical protein
MLAHRDAKAISLGTAGKLRILGEYARRDHHPERCLIFTNDNADCLPHFPESS